VYRYRQLSPTELVQKCVALDDAVAWREFIRRFQPLIAVVVLRTAQHWGPPPRQLLDDLIQETYLRLCEDNCRLLRTFQPRHPDAIYGFLRTVAANIVRDHFKSAWAGKRGVCQTDSLQEETSGATPAVSRGGFDAMDRHILLRQVDETLTRADGDDKERNRIIFWLYHRHGLTAREIAAFASIGMSVKGVETVLKRTTDMVRSHMASRSEGFRHSKSL